MRGFVITPKAAKIGTAAQPLLILSLSVLGEGDRKGLPAAVFDDGDPHRIPYAAAAEYALICAGP